MSEVVDDGHNFSTPTTWDNPNVPVQEYSLTVGACSGCIWKGRGEDAVPENEAFRDRKRTREQPKKYKEPETPQTKILYEAFRQLLTVSVCFKEGDVEQLQASEAAEVLASADPTKPRDPDAAPPRSFALTLLVRESRLCIHRRTWLDCMAYWANCLGVDEGDDARAAGDVRFTALADRDACKYGVKHGGMPRETAELALVYVATDGKVAMVKAPLEYKDTGRKMFAALRKTAALLFEHAERTPPRTLFRSMRVSSDDVENAFWKTWQHANEMFWDTIIHFEPPPPLHGDLLEFAEVFVKIGKDEHVKSDQAWSHEAVDFGMLCYKEGMVDALTEFLVNVRSEELARGAPEHAACLRPADRDSDELSLNLHILRVSHQLVSFKGLVSCFGARSAPGSPLAPWHKDLSWPGVRFDLTPFTRDTYNWVYVLTCKQERTHTARDDQTRAQFELTALGAKRYLECFGVHNHPEDVEELFRSLKRPCQVRADPQPEDAVLANLVGDPFFSGAFRIGDVYKELHQNTRVQMPALSAFLVSAMGQLGPDAPMASALATWAELRRGRDEEVAALRAELEALKSAAPPVVAPPPPDTGPYKLGIVKRMIVAMGRERSTTWRLDKCDNAARSKVIVKVLALSRGVEPDMARAEWGCDNCEGMGDVEAIAAIGHELGVALLIARTHGAGQAQFNQVVEDDDGKPKTQPISALDALELSISQDLAVVLYREENTQLVTCVPPSAGA
jgi:hypothetical protein